MIVFLICTIICAVHFGIGTIFGYDIHLHHLTHRMRKWFAFYPSSPELSTLRVDFFEREELLQIILYLSNHFLPKGDLGGRIIAFQEIHIFL
ncbi:hypothetical protein ACVLD2_001224 [Paenibacillus sp. PvR052]|nr:hypothetical protein [Paenibacillus sp. PvP091]MBP1169750.1 hypothetical protein [Paenibacillus sp. PvR098]MBP2440778.1 hypothetical protein [Paenibacillus sp. PvP052]